MGMTKMPGKRNGDKHSCGGRSACGARMYRGTPPQSFEDKKVAPPQKIADQPPAQENKD